MASQVNMNRFQTPGEKASAFMSSGLMTSPVTRFCSDSLNGAGAGAVVATLFAANLLAGSLWGTAFYAVQNGADKIISWTYGKLQWSQENTALKIIKTVVSSFAGIAAAEAALAFAGLTLSVTAPLTLSLFVVAIPAAIGAIVLTPALTYGIPFTVAYAYYSLQGNPQGIGNGVRV